MTFVEELPGEPRAARRARDVVRRRLAGRGELDTVTLLASELVTNAVVHGRGPLVFVLEAAPSVVRVSVLDHAQATPTAVLTGPMAEGGRGLAIVDALASRWGVERDGKGRWVWFEVDAHRPPSPLRHLGPRRRLRG